jgi:hypothetical protein
MIVTTDPIFYKIRKSGFTVGEASLFGGLGGAYIVIMKKNKNGKWIQTHIGYQIGIINYCITIGPRIY